MGSHTVSVTGMACHGCEQNVEDELDALDGVDSVAADHETDTVELVTDEELSTEQIGAAVERAGYELDN